MKLYLAFTFNNHLPHYFSFSFLPQVIKDPTLRERHIGDLQGLALRDAAKLKPKAYKILMSHNRDQEIPVNPSS